MIDSVLFTLLTMSACSYIDMYRCTIPRPPFRAIPTAIAYSVTVSIGLLTSGIFIGIFLLNFVVTLHFDRESIVEC